MFKLSLNKVMVLLSACGGAIGCEVLLRQYFVSTKEFNENVSLEGKTALVTGANSGIGKEVATELAKLGAKVFLLCRDRKQCENVRQRIVLSTRNKYVYCRHCDLASQESIHTFVKRFKKESSELHLLINNAGVMHCPQQFTKEGIELHLGINHMAHFLLTNLVLDIMKKSAPSRIINVTSDAHLQGKINFEDLNYSRHYNKTDAYNQSKLANVLFTQELAKRLNGTECCHMLSIQKIPQALEYLSMQCILDL